MQNKVNFTESEQAFLLKAEQYCSTSEQCCSSVREKLLNWGASRDLTERITLSLVDNGYIDEERYCRIYCDSKLHLQKWGRLKIAYQLRGKRINNVVIEKAIQEIDEELYRETLVKLAENKMHTIKEDDPRKRKAKLMSYLASHGFTHEEIENTINEILTNKQ
ncbi:MAG: RecX family transcriptional regulator [Bacteroidales bacterium]|nr:RecX family transcriptional regulator [Bacteroidales bacterium]